MERMDEKDYADVQNSVATLENLGSANVNLIVRGFERGVTIPPGYLSQTWQTKTFEELEGLYQSRKRSLRQFVIHEATENRIGELERYLSDAQKRLQIIFEESTDPKRANRFDFVVWWEGTDRPLNSENGIFRVTYYNLSQLSQQQKNEREMYLVPA